MLAVLNLMVVDWSNPFKAASFSNILAVVATATIPCVILMLVYFYTK